jgi:ATP-dependent DNA ligase
MSLPLSRPYLPMEARSVEQIPTGEGWQYEPKWDGFRCVAFRDGGSVELQSKAGESLTRYFPELVAALLAVGAKRFVLDGEIVVPEGDALSFDQLLQRIHPAESRVRKLAAEHPARYLVFDLLVDERGTSLASRPLAERRPRLERFASRYLDGETFALSPAASDAVSAKRWLDATGGALDGIIAKRLDLPYAGGTRDGMVKVKLKRTADCVVGGFRYAQGEKVVGSLLLGLYEDGVLHHVGFTSSMPRLQRGELTAKLEKLVKPPGFTGRAPGGPSRWSRGRSTEWQPLQPKLVVEVEFDHASGGRFRHGARLVRWRPDKAPKQCTMEQIERPRAGTLELLAGPAPARKRATRRPPRSRSSTSPRPRPSRAR